MKGVIEKNRDLQRPIDDFFQEFRLLYTHTWGNNSEEVLEKTGCNTELIHGSVHKFSQVLHVEQNVSFILKFET